MTPTPITLTRVTPADATLLDNLWQFYELESSFWSGEDIDAKGRFNSLSGFLGRLGDPDAFDWAYLIHQKGAAAGLLLVGHQNLRDGTIQRTILEFGDLYVLPKYRNQGIATEVIRQTILATVHPWLVCVFRDDLRALAFWDRAFKRLPFSSVREVVPPDVPEFVEFVVNDAALPPPV
jgi:predicted acetyltransferase